MLAKLTAVALVTLLRKNMQLVSGVGTVCSSDSHVPSYFR